MEGPRLKSLSKALEVLDYFSLEKPEAGVTEISEDLLLTKSNVYDILRTLEAYGYIEQNPKTKEYRLGYQTACRSFVYNNTTTSVQIIQKYLMPVVNEIGKTAYYAAIREDRVLYLGQCIPREMVWLQTDFGNVTGFMAPLHCTGVGKALFAFQTDEYINYVLDKGLPRFTDTTITTKEKMWEEIDQIRARGYAIDNMEHVRGIRCVGVPVLNANHIAELSISAHWNSLGTDDDEIPVIAEALLRCADQVAKAIGLRPY